MSIAASLTIAKAWKQPKCLCMDKWIKNTRIVFIHEIVENIAICDNLDEHWGDYAKLNKSGKNKYCMI